MGEVWPPKQRKRPDNPALDTVEAEEPDGGELLPLDSTRDTPGMEDQDQEAREAEEDMVPSLPRATLPTIDPQLSTMTEVPDTCPGDTAACHSLSQEPSGMPDEDPSDDVDQYLSRPVAGRWLGCLRKRTGHGRRRRLDPQQGEM